MTPPLPPPPAHPTHPHALTFTFTFTLTPTAHPTPTFALTHTYPHSPTHHISIPSTTAARAPPTRSARRRVPFRPRATSARQPRWSTRSSSHRQPRPRKARAGSPQSLPRRHRATVRVCRGVGLPRHRHHARRARRAPTGATVAPAAPSGLRAAPTCGRRRAPHQNPRLVAHHRAVSAAATFHLTTLLSSAASPTKRWAREREREKGGRPSSPRERHPLRACLPPSSRSKKSPASRSRRSLGTQGRGRELGRCSEPTWETLQA
jgi:hypothetical protein